MKLGVSATPVSMFMIAPTHQAVIKENILSRSLHQSIDTVGMIKVCLKVHYFV